MSIAKFGCGENNYAYEPPAEPLPSSPAGPTGPRYRISTDDLVDALAAIGAAFPEEGIGGYKCVCWNGVRISVMCGKPPKRRNS